MNVNPDVLYDIFGARAGSPLLATTDRKSVLRGPECGFLVGPGATDVQSLGEVCLRRVQGYKRRLYLPAPRLTDKLLTCKAHNVRALQPENPCAVCDMSHSSVSQFWPR